MARKIKTKLRRAIEKAGIKPVEIASRLGVGKANISHQMQSGIKTIRVAQRYAKVLHCDAVELLEL